MWEYPTGLMGEETEYNIRHREENIIGEKEKDKKGKRLKEETEYKYIQGLSTNTYKD